MPAHKRASAAIARIIGTLIDERPRIVNHISEALGAPKDCGKGPFTEDVLECRDRLADYLKADIEMDAGRTEIIAPLVRAWAEAANGPD